VKNKKHTAQSAFFNLRALVGLLVCGAAASSMLSGALLAFFPSEVASKSSQRSLTFEQRVAYQLAIEDVYWCHRIWPKERRDPKPSLDAVMSQAQLEKKVEDYLHNSQTLDYWQRPITAEQLQAEMDRMAQHTKQPEVLRELFEALGNNPFIIAECLARPVLAERLTGDSSVQHRPDRLESGRVKGLHSMSIVTMLGNVAYTLPKISDGNSPCTDDNWAPTSPYNAPSPRSYHTGVWTGTEMIVWGGFGSSIWNTGGRYNPSTDSWIATSTSNAPSARYGHTAVWTGTEMIVWGGIGAFSNDLNTGGRYNPGTDSWIATSTSNAPSARQGHTAVWTGSEMIIWGGAYDNGGPPQYFNTGGRYNPSTNSWTATSITNAPVGRELHTAVWAGNEMIIWGGDRFGSYLNTGGRYNPTADTWAATSTTNAPSPRSIHTGVWAGTEMIVWGGVANTGVLNTGGRYNPGTDTWIATSTSNAPSARQFHAAVWCGSEMIVWGGAADSTGGRYNPSTDSWTATSTSNAPGARYLHTAVWTGSEMIVWGGYNGSIDLNSGGRYGPTPTGCSATSITCGRIVVGTAPTDFTVNLSNAADPTTVQGSDFMVNGTPANTATLSNGNTTITFHFNTSPVVQGQNTMHIPAGAFNCGNGGVQDFTCMFVYEVRRPTPTPRPFRTPPPPRP
jgi:N-acetylneuraminic acid mutarotase